MDRAIAVVMAWCVLYSHGVPDTAAAIRREELLRDLTDQVEWSAVRDIPQRRVAASMYGRALRGAPADVSWRLSQRAWTRLGSPVFRGFGVGLLSATAASGLALAALAVAAVMRAVQAGTPELIGRRPETLVFVAAAALLLGELLLARSRTRSVGALWMLVAAEIVVFVGLPLLAGATRILSFASLSSGWALSLDLAGVGVALFYLVGVLWWLGATSPPKEKS
jgi:uncharacterized protein (DUF2062 family)